MLLRSTRPTDVFRVQQEISARPRQVAESYMALPGYTLKKEPESVLVSEVQQQGTPSDCSFKYTLNPLLPAPSPRRRDAKCIRFIGNISCAYFQRPPSQVHRPRMSGGAAQPLFSRLFQKKKKKEKRKPRGARPEDVLLCFAG